MIFGDGPLQAILLHRNGTAAATLTLARPVRRDIEDYEDVTQNYGPDASGQPYSEWLGVRFHAVYVWISHGGNQDEMATVQRMANWRGHGRTVRLIPHTDEPHQAVLCEVAGNPIRPVDGKVWGEEIRLEFWGNDLLPSKPNPAYDRISRALGRAFITT